MFIDIAIPSGNEEKFVERAKLLGAKGIIFLYDKDKKENLEAVEKLNSKDFKVYSAFLNKLSKKYDFFFSIGTRQDFENRKTSVIFDLEKQPKKDNFHYKSSGMNQVLAKLAKEKNICIGFNFNAVLRGKNKPLVLGRMMQNVVLCKKYKAKMLIASFAKKPNNLRFWKDLISFGVVLGMNQKEATGAVNRKL